MPLRRPLLSFAQQANLFANNAVAKSLSLADPRRRQRYELTTVSFSLATERLGQQITETMLQQHYDEFYEEVFFEIEDKYGEIEEMNVCENLGDHLVGNVYIKFYRRV